MKIPFLEVRRSGMFVSVWYTGELHCDVDKERAVEVVVKVVVDNVGHSRAQKACEAASGCEYQ